MGTITISVPDVMRDWVERRVEAGRYASAEDYVRDLIRHDQELSEMPPLSVADIRRSIQANERDGTTLPADVVFDRIEAKLRDRLRSE